MSLYFALAVPNTNILERRLCDVTIVTYLDFDINSDNPRVGIVGDFFFSVDYSPSFTKDISFQILLQGNVDLAHVSREEVFSEGSYESQILRRIFGVKSCYPSPNLAAPAPFGSERVRDYHVGEFEIPSFQKVGLEAENHIPFSLYDFKTYEFPARFLRIRGELSGESLDALRGEDDFPQIVGGGCLDERIYKQILEGNGSLFFPFYSAFDDFQKYRFLPFEQYFFMRATNPDAPMIFKGSSRDLYSVCEGHKIGESVITAYKSSERNFSVSIFPTGPLISVTSADKRRKAV